MPKLIDMTGWVMREHGVPDSRITVIQRADHKYKDGHIPWVCKCDCGNTFESLGNHIRKGGVKSCGCLNKERSSQNAIKRNINSKPSLIDMTGWVMKEHGVEYSKLTVLEYLGNSMWKCKCECGSICNVNSTALRKGTTRSCGCLNSLNEVKIRDILISYGISFKEQQTFDDLVVQYKLRFDFGIYKDDQLLFLLEYQGQQHYKDTQFGHYARITDPIKKQYCQDKGIKLYEIRYDENLTDTLLDILRKEGFNV